jgi:transcriptional regulator with XRE-family HTH domain
MTQGERIKEIRKALGLTLDKFGERVGVKKSALSSLENGRSNLTDQLALSICREYGVNPEYLSGESDQIFLQMSKSDQLAAFFGDVLRDEEDDFRRRFISMLSQLSTEDWKLLEKVLDRMNIKKD